MATLGVFAATYKARARQEPYVEAIANFNSFADTVVEVDTKWEQEFKWDFIGQRFQEGYDNTNADWVMRMDLDYFIHEDDFAKLRAALQYYKDYPALSLYKHQFILVDRYNLKSRVVNLLNKKLYGDRIKLDSGGDLCQPSLDGKLLDINDIPEAKIPLWNYDFSFKEKEVVFEDFGRFARAWHRHFGEYKFGGPKNRNAFEHFMKMQLGRVKKPSAPVWLEQHPVAIQEKIRTLKGEQFGYSLWGHVPPAKYYVQE